MEVRTQESHRLIYVRPARLFAKADQRIPERIARHAFLFGSLETILEIGEVIHHPPIEGYLHLRLLQAGIRFATALEVRHLL